MTCSPPEPVRRERAAKVHGRRWFVVTGEYPPQPGGVADYTRLVVRALADAGDGVEVWAPACEGAGAARLEDVTVHRLSGGFGVRGLRRLRAAVRASPSPPTVLLQYVPHAFGWRGLNLPFCAALGRLGAPVWTMFHEVAYPFVAGQPWRHHLLATGHRAMAALALAASDRVFLSTSAWEPLLGAISRGPLSALTLPVPSNLPTEVDPARVAHLRQSFASPDLPLVGHFGTYGPSVTRLLDAAWADLLRCPPVRVCLFGRGAREYRTGLGRTGLPLERIHAVDAIAPAECAAWVAACDLLLQPYPDGITTRRGTAMASLALGRPLVTTSGHLTEGWWSDAGAVTLVPVDAPAGLAPATLRLLADPAARQTAARRGAALYEQRFALRHTIAALRGRAP